MIDFIQPKVRQIQKETDILIREFESCCEKGCSFCCNQVIAIYAAEELPITEYLDSKVNSKIKKRLKSNILNWLAYFEESTPDNKLLDDFDIFKFEKKHALDRISCPFLINNSCMIYQVRPIVCRTHIVPNNPEQCKTNPLRDTINAAQEIRYSKMEELRGVDLRPNNYLRLLPYAFTTYFKIKKNLKPIKQISSKYFQVKI